MTNPVQVGAYYRVRYVLATLVLHWHGIHMRANHGEFKGVRRP